MQTRVLARQVPSVILWKDGHTTLGSPAYDLDNLHIAWQTAARAKPANPAPTPFRFWKVFGNGLRGRCLRNNPSSGYLSASGGLSSVLDGDGEIFTSPSTDEALAREHALGKLSDAVRPADMSIDLFQWRMTMATINRLTHLVRTTRDSYINIIRRQGPIKEFANLYLEFTYGIEPTVKTLFAAYDLLMRKSLDANRLVHFRGRGRVTRNWSEQALTVLFGYTNCRLDYDIHSSVRCQIDVWLKPDFNRVQKLSQYTSLDPISWAYELTLYSFVLDWFWNFGGYLRDLETALTFGAQFHSGTETYTWEKLSQVRPGKYVAFDGESSCSDVTGFHNFRLYDRRVLTSYPLPRVPVLKADLGWRRILNAAALLAQFLPDLHKRATMKGSFRKVTRARGLIIPT